MAKGNMLLGQARGKVGSLVFSRSNGQQIVRTHNEKPRNPRSVAQQLQRMIMATVSSARGILSPIVDHSFEGVRYGQDSLSEFSRVNMATLRAIALDDINGVSERGNFSIKGSGIAPINAYMVSKGSLNLTPNTLFSYSTQQFDYSLLSYLGTQVEFNVSTRDVFETLGGLKPGDQLTLVAMAVNPLQFDQYEDAILPISFMNWCRIVFKKDFDLDTAFTVSAGDEDTFTINPAIIDADRSINAGEIFMREFLRGGVGYAGIGVRQPAASPLEVRGLALILSRQDSNGKWLRSTSYMQVYSDIFSPAKDAIGSFSDVSANNLGSTRILNNAISETAAASAPVQTNYAAALQNVATDDGISSTTGDGTVNLTFNRDIFTEEPDYRAGASIEFNYDPSAIPTVTQVAAETYYTVSSRVNGTKLYVNIIAKYNTAATVQANTRIVSITAAGKDPFGIYSAVAE